MFDNYQPRRRLEAIPGLLEALAIGQEDIREIHGALPGYFVSSEIFYFQCVCYPAMLLLPTCCGSEGCRRRTSQSSRRSSHKRLLLVTPKSTSGFMTPLIILIKLKLNPVFL